MNVESLSDKSVSIFGSPTAELADDEEDELADDEANELADDEANELADDEANELADDEANELADGAGVVADADDADKVSEIDDVEAASDLEVDATGGEDAQAESKSTTQIDNMILISFIEQPSLP